jgi:hypothetical protein
MMQTRKGTTFPYATLIQTINTLLHVALGVVALFAWFRNTYVFGFGGWITWYVVLYAVDLVEWITSCVFATTSDGQRSVAEAMGRHGATLLRLTWTHTIADIVLGVVVLEYVVASPPASSLQWQLRMACLVMVYVVLELSLYWNSLTSHYAASTASNHLQTPAPTAGHHRFKHAYPDEDDEDDAL